MGVNQPLKDAVFALSKDKPVSSEPFVVLGDAMVIGLENPRSRPTTSSRLSLRRRRRRCCNRRSSGCSSAISTS